MKLRHKSSASPSRRRPDVTRPGVFSYYSQVRTDNEPNTGRGTEVIEVNASHRLRHIPTYIATILIIAAALYSLWLKPSPKIVIIGQANTIYLPAETYQQDINELWRHSLLNQTKMTLNSSRLITEIKQKFPELARVEIELPLLGQRPTVVLSPDQPALQLTNNQGSFYVSSTGKVLAQVDKVRTQKLQPLPVVKDATGVSTPVGTAFLPEPHVTFVTDIFAYLQAAKVSVDSMTLSGTSAHEVDVHLKGKGYYLKFNLLSDAKQAVGSYLAARTHIVPQSYIDLRVPEKLFYK